ncbi:hypothetical protein AVEN_186188-1 [Araneus ventricosus]|uniref:Uncharacterized protein n=1 Tax=Araneus ventricosus TaxID=182803 RepID=A0A4Y2GE87_ARAVE|nr:hypothetical protein AVEN_186188-1 [Araneus ventricosus]
MSLPATGPRSSGFFPATSPATPSSISIDELDEPTPPAEFHIVHFEDDMEFEENDSEEDEGINSDFFQFRLAGERADNRPPTPSKPYRSGDIEYWDTGSSKSFDLGDLMSALPRTARSISMIL